MAMTNTVDEPVDLAALLDRLLQAWNADRSAMVRLVELSDRTSTALCELMAALREARKVDNVPVMLSRELLLTIQEWVAPDPPTGTTGELRILLGRDLSPLLKRNP